MNSNLFEHVNRLLSNPATKTLIYSSNPTIGLGLDLLSLFLQKRPPYKMLLQQIDVRLAFVLKEITKSNNSVEYNRELEIRAHELLGIVVWWNDA